MAELPISRRAFLARSGLGAAALAGLLQRELPASAGARPRLPHFAPRARAVIYLNMTGAPSQFDLFDKKPLLEAEDGRPVPKEYLAGQRFAFIAEGQQPNLLGPRWPLRPRGATGAHVSDLLPHFAEVADLPCWLRAMTTDEINHVPAQLFMVTGSPRMGRPALGSWVVYGLGSACEDLPGYIVLASGKAGRCGTICWGAGFLPSEYQGVQFRSAGDPVLALQNPAGIGPELRRDTLDVLRTLNEGRLAAIGDPEIAARIASYEMAFRMQASVPGLLDFADEPESIRALYGAGPGPAAAFSNHCLLARRLVERGVRFVELTHGGWDHHGGGDQNLVTGLPERCREVDQGMAALLVDLRQRGLLDDVLVVFGTEFGRTPMLQGAFNAEDLGRDHLRTAFTMWVAGAGVKRGFSFGATDDLGMTATKDAVHVHDFQATLLHLLGLDHERLTYKFQGRPFRLTDVAGRVVREILA